MALATIEFCCGKRRCPVVKQMKGDQIKLGGKKEGETVWGKDQFKDFVEAAKNGTFDELIK